MGSPSSAFHSAPNPTDHVYDIKVDFAAKRHEHIYWQIGFEDNSVDSPAPICTPWAQVAVKEACCYCTSVLGRLALWGCFPDHMNITGSKTANCSKAAGETDRTVARVTSYKWNVWAIRQHPLCVNTVPWRTLHCTMELLWQPIDKVIILKAGFLWCQAWCVTFTVKPYVHDICVVAEQMANIPDIECVAPWP